MRKFEPWRGIDYNRGGLSGARVLVLGESHYGEPGEENPSFTQEVVKYRGQQIRNRFFTVIAKLLLGLPIGVRISDGERAALWEKVAYYNFVQSFVGARAGMRPTREMWEEGAVCFPSVVAELDPSVVLVLGKALASWLPAIHLPTRCCSIPHPSSHGFRYSEWLPIVQKQLRS